MEAGRDPQSDEGFQLHAFGRRRPVPGPDEPQVLLLLLVTDPYGPYLFRKVLGRRTVIGTVQHDIGPLFCKKRVWKVRIQEREEQKLTGDAEQLGILRHTVPGSCHVPQGKEGF